MDEAGPYELSHHQSDAGTQLGVRVTVEPQDVVHVLLQLWGNTKMMHNYSEDTNINTVILKYYNL